VLWEIGLDDDCEVVAKCESCGYLGTELETWEHQSNVAAETLTAAGFGPVKEAKAEALREAANALMDVSEHDSRMPGIRFAVGFLAGQRKP
jgi:hypothetical protein